MRISDLSSTCALPIFFVNVRFINLNFNCAFFVFSDNSMLSFMRKSLIQYQLANKQYFIVSSKYFYFLRESGKNILQCKRNGFSNRFIRSEEHTSELQSLMRISYAVFCLKKKNNKYII